MIGVVDIEIAAHNPEMVLWPLKAFVNSHSALRLRNVPKSVGKWKITGVQLVAEYPDGTVKTAECVAANNLWLGTIEGTATPGTSENGYTVYASGVDENGNAVNGYVLGKGDVEIISADATLTPGETLAYMHLLSAEPAQGKEGDVYRQAGGGYAVWQDGQANPLGLTEGDLSAYAMLSDVQAVGAALSGYLPLSGGEMSGTISAASGIDTISWGVDGALFASTRGVYVRAGDDETFLFNNGQFEQTPYDVMRRADVDAQLGDISTLIHNI